MVVNGRVEHIRLWQNGFAGFQSSWEGASNWLWRIALCIRTAAPRVDGQHGPYASTIRSLCMRSGHAAVARGVRESCARPHSWSRPYSVGASCQRTRTSDVRLAGMTETGQVSCRKSRGKGQACRRGVDSAPKRAVRDVGEKSILWLRRKGRDRPESAIDARRGICSDVGRGGCEGGPWGAAGRADDLRCSTSARWLHAPSTAALALRSAWARDVNRMSWNVKTNGRRAR